MNNQYRVVVFDSILGTVIAQAYFLSKVEAESFALVKRMDGSKVAIEDLSIVGNRRVLTRS